MKEKYIRPCVETIVMVPEPCMAANSPATQTTDKTTGITSGAARLNMAVMAMVATWEPSATMEAGIGNWWNNVDSDLLHMALCLL